MSLFNPKTVKSVVSAIYAQIDELEKISAQQTFITEQRALQIDALRAEQGAAYAERNYAEKVANKLRALVEV